LVQKTVDLLSHVANEKQIEMIFHPSPAIPMIPGDAPSLQRAINNLVANAVKYTPAGGKIEITLHPHSAPPCEGTVEVSIRDTGVGIPQEDLQSIFEPFYRGNNVGEEKGIGLGLALVREVIALHGGKILVRSEPGQGSTFLILLPTGRVNQEREVSDACNETVNNL
jgi:signal transduction histidine kinase